MIALNTLIAIKPPAPYVKTLEHAGGDMPLRDLPATRAEIAEDIRRIFAEIERGFLEYNHVVLHRGRGRLS